MDILQIVRALGALSAVLTLLGAALWIVRRMEPSHAGRFSGRRVSRLGLVERITLDQKRSLALIRNGAAQHLLLLAPEGNMLLGEGASNAEQPMVIDLAACRLLASAVPLPPTPVQPLWPDLPLIHRRSPGKPVHDPLPLRLI